MTSRVLLLFSTTGYTFREYLRAAEHAGIECVPASDRCKVLDDPWGDSALALRFEAPDESVETLVEYAAQTDVHGIVATDDATTVIAARAAERLGLRTTSPISAARARNKAQSHAACQAAGISVPAFRLLEDEPELEAALARYPCVLKPLRLSASRGVIRADDPGEFVEACATIRAILSDPELQARQGEDAEAILVESFVPGDELALEGLLVDGELYTLAVFEKPDPLNGPHFAETLYITPPRIDDGPIRAVVARACDALGLTQGPVHAEVRMSEHGPVLLEVASRSIGGLCARTLQFGAGISLEEVVLRHACAKPLDDLKRVGEASGVMMLPVPRAGVFKGASGLERAASHPGVVGVEITAKVGQPVWPLPQGSSYLGFIFARGENQAAVEASLRGATAHLSFEITARLAVE